MPLRNAFSNTFETVWQASLVKLPRAVPTLALKFTSPDGPHPYILDLPSRDKKRTIPVYVFIPNVVELRDLIETSNSATQSPENAQNAKQTDPPLALPVLLDFHGGGFFMGSPLEQAPFCAFMSRSLPALVLSIDYRMAPFDKFPAAIHDAEDVLRFVLDPSSAGGIPLAQSVETKCKEALARLKQPKPAKEDGKETKAAPTVPPPRIRPDPTRVAVAGFSSGANIALNMGISVPATPPVNTEPWPSPFPSTYPTPIPLLLFYPSLDLRALPSERVRPENLPPGSPFWARLADNLAPTYVSRELSGHPRASPGLASIRDGLHKRAKMLLVLPELDVLSEQSERWVCSVEEGVRGADLQVERCAGMKHGWTQFPESFLDARQKDMRDKTFKKSLDLMRECWGMSTSKKVES